MISSGCRRAICRATADLPTAVGPVSARARSGGSLSSLVHGPAAGTMARHQGPAHQHLLRGSSLAEPTLWRDCALAGLVDTVGGCSNGMAGRVDMLRADPQPGPLQAEQLGDSPPILRLANCVRVVVRSTLHRNKGLGLACSFEQAPPEVRFDQAVLGAVHHQQRRTN